MSKDVVLVIITKKHAKWLNFFSEWRDLAKKECNIELMVFLTFTPEIVENFMIIESVSDEKSFDEIKNKLQAQGASLIGIVRTVSLIKKKLYNMLTEYFKCSEPVCDQASFRDKLEFQKVLRKHKSEQYNVYPLKDTKIKSKQELKKYLRQNGATIVKPRVDANSSRGCAVVHEINDIDKQWEICSPYLEKGLVAQPYLDNCVELRWNHFASGYLLEYVEIDKNFSETSPYLRTMRLTLSKEEQQIVTKSLFDLDEALGLNKLFHRYDLLFDPKSKKIYIIDLSLKVFNYRALNMLRYSGEHRKVLLSVLQNFKKVNEESIAKFNFKQNVVSLNVPGKNKGVIKYLPSNGELVNALNKQFNKQINCHEIIWNFSANQAYKLPVNSRNEYIVNIILTVPMDWGSKQIQAVAPVVQRLIQIEPQQQRA